MVRKNFEDDVNLRKTWEDANFLGRIAQPHEFRGGALFLLSDASSFMTGSQVRLGFALLLDGQLTSLYSLSLMVATRHGRP